ncbi:MAG: LamG-like jellyroll fold domain-containing protein [Verrucomicrobiota bacterium]
MNRAITPLVFATLTSLMFGTGVFAQESQTILRWSFDEPNEPGTWEGKAKISDVRGDGPRKPRYPEFEATNQSAFFPGRDAHLVVKDEEAGGDANIRFGLGETLTLEAWVKIDSIGRGHLAYLIGKGRHLDKGEGLGDMNQNYAMRLKGDTGGAQLGFLFTSQHPETNKRDWHRWWSSEVVPDSGWHHISLVYTFGKADSLQARIDGKLVNGVWDLGGATDLPPVTDRDDLVVGTGYSRGTK